MLSRDLRALASLLVLFLPVHVSHATTPQELDYCGGANQRACCFDEAGPSCDPGNIEVDSTGGTCAGPTSGGGTFLGIPIPPSSAGQCIPNPALPENNPQCGGPDQRACCVGEAAPSCDPGLTEIPSSTNTCPGTIIPAGQCIQITPCGNPGQRACCASEQPLACNPGAAPLTGGIGADEYCGGASGFIGAVPGRTCVAESTQCGGQGQRACCIIEQVSEGKTACQSGLDEYIGITGDGTCSDGITTSAATGICAAASPPRISDPATDWQPATSSPLPAGSLRGFMDMHLHLLAHQGHGQKVLVGTPAPTNPDGSIDVQGTPDINVSMSPALDQDLHDGALHLLVDDPISDGTNDRSRSFNGAPYFNGWPSWNSTTHQQSYYKWLERAWRGGMRATVMLAVTNEALCKGKFNRDFERAQWDACSNSMTAINAQLDSAWAFQAFIDRQSGGNGRGWFRIVTTPEDARNVIRAGKLAVVLGIEVDNLFGCKETGCPTGTDLDLEVQKIYDKGVRHVFPIHNFDNAFGAAAAWQDSINAGQALSEGRWWLVENCGPQGYGFWLDNFISSAVYTVGFLFKGNSIPTVPEYVNGNLQPGYASCNLYGLRGGTAGLGAQLLQSLMSRGMMIDIDHMSNKSLDQTLAIVNAGAQKYPLVASHVQFFDRHPQKFEGNAGRHERMRTRAQLDAIKDGGGMIAAMLKDDVQDTGLGGKRYTWSYTTPLKGQAIADDCVHSSKSFAQSYQYAADVMDGPVAFGSDFNGIAGHLGPRFGSEACASEMGNAQGEAERLAQEEAGNRIGYPFEIPGFGTLDRQVTGFKTFDYNVDGMAHVGLLPDFIADLKAIGMSDAYMDDIFCSAERYMQVWQRARAVGAGIGTIPDYSKMTCNGTAPTDTTAPVSSAAASPAANAFGWNNGQVAVTVTASDEVGGSGLESISYTATGASNFADTPPGSPAQFNVTAQGTTAVSYFARDNAGNEEAAKTLTLNLDLTPPTISGATTMAANAAGWFKTAASIAYTCADALSGIETCTALQTLPEGLNQQTTGTATDKAGNTATATVTGINVDLTLPTISGAATPPANAAGWNMSAVAVDFTCADALSGIASCGPDQSFTTETASVTATGTAVDSAGNSQQTTVGPLRIDLTAPTIAGAAAPLANAAGWNNSAVTIDYTCGDALSGVASCGPDQTLSTETPFAGTTSTGNAADVAGNTAQTSVGPIRIDLVAPTVAGAASPAANGYGWNNTAVTVSYTCSDNLSGVASCSPDESFTAETTVAGSTATGAVTDVAGNGDQTTVGPVRIDLTKPTISGAAAPAPNAAGWNNTDVTVTYTCNDALSGVATCTAPQTLVEGAAQSSTGTAVDKAGNSDTATVSGINVDKTKPVVTVTGVANGAIYTFGSVPAAGCSTTDALSGVQTSATVTVSGGTSNGVGTFKARCDGAVDVADNAGTAVEVTYQVHYDFTGFFNPVDNVPMINSVKAGQGIPMKFSLAGNFGLDILAAASPSSASISCLNPALNVLDETETVTAGSSSLQYDALSGQYIYVWKTDKAWATKCRAFLLKLDDGTTHRADFNFRK